jgi:hypothetical protein
MENFVYTTNKNGDVEAGGYKINNKLLTNTINGGGALTDMIVPAGLFISKKILEKNKNLMSKTEDNVEVVGEDLYSKLLNLVQPNSKTNIKRKTRRVKRKIKNKTTRRKR